MKILIFSDSHKRMDGMKLAVLREQPELVLHLGDHISDMRSLQMEYPAVRMIGVKGNCDFTSLESDENTRLITIEEKRILMTHGHLYNVKFGLDKLMWYAMEQQADIVLFGHTHRPLRDMYKEMWVVNPGTIGSGGELSYAVVNINSGKISCDIKRLS